MDTQPNAQQLTLLPAPDVPVQFRIDEATRKRGLRHIAEIRLHLAERQAARVDDHTAVTRRTAA